MQIASLLLVKICKNFFLHPKNLLTLKIKSIYYGSMIPLIKPTIVRKDLEYVLNCLITERLEEGELAREFEKSVANFVGAKDAVATNSFTSAMHLALLALDIKPDDEIIISAYADLPVINAISYTGAKPVPIDIEPDTFNIDAEKVKKKITEKTKAVIVSNKFGIPSDIDEFLSLPISVIEDCSYALGAEYNSSVKEKFAKIGSFGLLSVFSFDTDTIITTGNGGMIVSNSRDIITKAKKHKFNPFKVPENYKVQYDYRMQDVTAALGLSQMKLINKFIARRIELANYYNQRFMKSKYKIYREDSDKKSVYSKYTLLVDGSLKKTIETLRRHKIMAKRPIEMPALLSLNLNEEEYPNTAHAYHKLMEIPIYPSLKKKEIESIADNVLKVL